MTTANRVTAKELALAFSAEIRTALTEDQLAEVVRLNRAESNPSVCHSHDFIDANEAMAEAFSRVAGRPVDVTSDDDSSVWGAAWNIAVAAEFFHD